MIATRVEFALSAFFHRYCSINRCLAAVADAVEVAADHAVVRAADHAVVRAAALVVHRAVAAPVVGDVAEAVVEDAAVNERSAAGVRAVFSTICHVV
ncbi:unnamed protein product [Arctia plantaginis]|uniref:Uncharacterized protein n=1 Tax=Arctia plantaginis TaxID=874455 RepID=A0A8S0ZLN0_ARCPL|nr:unnamed protein product [Arctia plantaginis]